MWKPLVAGRDAACLLGNSPSPRPRSCYETVRLQIKIPFVQSGSYELHVTGQKPALNHSLLEKHLPDELSYCRPGQLNNELM